MRVVLASAVLALAGFSAARPFRGGFADEGATVDDFSDRFGSGARGITSSDLGGVRPNLLQSDNSVRENNPLGDDFWDDEPSTDGLGSGFPDSDINLDDSLSSFGRSDDNLFDTPRLSSSSLGSSGFDDDVDIDNRGGLTGLRTPPIGPSDSINDMSDEDLMILLRDIQNKKARDENNDIFASNSGSGDADYPFGPSDSKFPGGSSLDFDESPSFPESRSRRLNSLNNIPSQSFKD